MMEGTFALMLWMRTSNSVLRWVRTTWNQDAEMHVALWEETQHSLVFSGLSNGMAIIHRLFYSILPSSLKMQVLLCPLYR